MVVKQWTYGKDPKSFDREKETMATRETDLFKLTWMHQVSTDGKL